MAKQSPLIAVVDDDPFVRKAFERLLRSAGFAVEAYPSGAEFLLSMDTRRPDCVLLDLHMPGTSGLEVLAQLRLGHSAMHVVVVTGHHSAESQSRALKGGAKAYLCKPVDDKTLLSAISNAIGF
jgi:FixJ family two-component response regulator